MQPTSLREPRWQRLAARHALKLVAIAALASCGGSHAPDTSALAEEDMRYPFNGAPVDTGAGPGVAYDESAADGRKLALGAQPQAAGGIAIPDGGPTGYLKGVFGEAFNWPIIPLHTILLPDGRVLSYGTKPSGIQGGLLHYAIWDPSLGMGSKSKLLLSNTTGTDIFCAGQALLPGSGNVLIVGGDRVVNGQRNYANRDVNLFTPSDNALTKQGAQMAYQRWYATMITTGTGEEAVIGGRDDKYWEGNDQYPPTEDTYANIPEVFNPDTGWRTLTSAKSDYAYGAILQSWNYPRAWWSPDGHVVIFTVSGKIFSLDVAGTGKLAQLPGVLPKGAFMLPAAMYQPGKILAVRDEAKAVVVDINGPTPVITPAAPLSADRQYGNATVLADGKVWANGGSTTGNDLVGAIFESELWDPATGAWTMTAAAAKPRLYHSTSMLMPDATVLTGGGGAPGPVTNLNAEIYFPPYLYLKDGSGLPAPRPGIAAAPSGATYGDVIAVKMADKKAVARMTLVRFGAVTHAFSNEQRFQDVPFTQKGQNLTVSLPSSADQAPPGFYMLFALNADGVPSKARILRLGPA